MLVKSQYLFLVVLIFTIATGGDSIFGDTKDKHTSVTETSYIGTETLPLEDFTAYCSNWNTDGSTTIFQHSKNPVKKVLDADQTGESRSENSVIKANIGKAFLTKVHLEEIEFPVDDIPDKKDDAYEITLKLWEDNENSSFGLNKLAVIKQANIPSFVSVKEFVADTKFLIKYQKYVLKEYNILCTYLTVFSHYLSPSPFKSGIAIHAP